MENSKETLNKGHQRQRQIWGKQKKKKSMQGAKERERNQSKNLQSGFITMLPSPVPKLHDKLSARHFTQVTVARHGCVTW